MATRSGSGGGSWEVAKVTRPPEEEKVPEEEGARAMSEALGRGTLIDPRDEAIITRCCC